MWLPQQLVQSGFETESREVDMWTQFTYSFVSAVLLSDWLVGATQSGGEMNKLIKCLSHVSHIHTDSMIDLEKIITCSVFLSEATTD